MFKKFLFSKTKLKITFSIFSFLIMFIMTFIALSNVNFYLNPREPWGKTYEILYQATILMTSDNNGSLKGLFINDDAMKDMYKKYLSYKQECSSVEKRNKCWPEKVTYLNGIKQYQHPGSGLILKNGSLIKFQATSPTCKSFINGESSINRCGVISIDTNGLKGPNKIGQDIFFVYTLDKSILPYGSKGDSYYNKCDTLSGSGLGCAAKFLK